MDSRDASASKNHEQIKLLSNIRFLNKGYITPVVSRHRLHVPFEQFPAQTSTLSPAIGSPASFFSPPSLFFLATFPLQMLQLQSKHSIVVLKMTSRKGITKQDISQISIIFISEVGGSSSILLVKMVVITSMMVKFTAMASPKRSLSKKMVVKVMRSRRMVVDRWSPGLWTPSSSASEP